MDISDSVKLFGPPMANRARRKARREYMRNVQAPDLVDYLTPEETSLSKLDGHDWEVLKSRWLRGIDWCVRKIGRRWSPLDCFGAGWPLFKTKSAAFDAVDQLMSWEARRRAALRG